MTPQKGSSVYADIRQQIATLVWDEAVTAAQIGKLREAVSQQGELPNLHLGDMVKKTAAKASASYANRHRHLAYITSSQVEVGYVRHRTEVCLSAAQS